jgi:AraC-like DNA-binding protein
MAEEARRQRIGMATLLPRLADIIVTLVVRHWAENSNLQPGGWLNALRDPGLGKAIVAIHREPARPWTAATLARTAGMSRTAFAARFSAALKQPPGQYLLETRMGIARERLSHAGSTIASTAEAVGYGSEAAFSRAFKRVTGSSPGAFSRLSSG